MFGIDGFFLEDVLAEILLRLAVIHLARLRCVCKSWFALIDDISFIKRHYQRQCSICKVDGAVQTLCFGPHTDVSDHSFRVCLVSQHRWNVPLCLTSNLAHDSATYFANTPNLFDSGAFIGVVNGVVCFIWGFQNLVLWNPATREFKPVTPWLNHSIGLCYLKLFGFGFDFISKDFKIVRGNRRDDGTLDYEVYSLATNSWKRLKQPLPLFCVLRCPFPEAYLNGVCYWFAENFDTRAILSFDFRTEEFTIFYHPLKNFAFEIEYKYNMAIKVYKDSLAFVVTSTDLEKELSNFDVWVATEFGGNSRIPLSWQHSFTIGPFLSSNVLQLDSFKMDDEVVFIIRSPSIQEDTSLYNFSTGTFKNLGFTIGLFFEYVESLFPLTKRLVWS
ncbi:hypothetical protein vseg_015121 [Gypsophila vaccaria]